MLAYAIILILVVPAAFLSSTIESLFSPDELAEMGICLGSHRTEEPLSTQNSDYAAAMV
jgi:hypothetical protein